MAVLCIIQDSHFVVIEVNPVDKSIHQCLPIFQVIHIAIAELVQEEPHFIDRGRRVGGSLQKNLLLQLVAFPFLLGDTLRNTRYFYTYIFMCNLLRCAKRCFIMWV